MNSKSFLHLKQKPSLKVSTRQLADASNSSTSAGALFHQHISCERGIAFFNSSPASAALHLSPPHHLLHVDRYSDSQELSILNKGWKSLAFSPS